MSPPRALQNSALNNGAPAESITLQTLNQGNEWIAGYVSGAPPITGVPPISPPTPMLGASGGHDHSGGIMGRPQLHTVWHTAFGTITQTDMFNNDAPRERETVAFSPVTLMDRWVGPIIVPGGEAYTDLEFEALIHVETATVDYSVEVTHPAALGFRVTQTGTLATGDNWITLANRVNTIPGAVQQVRVRISLVENGGGIGVANLYFAALHQTKAA